MSAEQNKPALLWSEVTHSVYTRVWMQTSDSGVLPQSAPGSRTQLGDAGDELPQPRALKETEQPRRSLRDRESTQAALRGSPSSLLGPDPGPACRVQKQKLSCQETGGQALPVLTLPASCLQHREGAQKTRAVASALAWN